MYSDGSTGEVPITREGDGTSRNWVLVVVIAGIGVGVCALCGCLFSNKICAVCARRLKKNKVETCLGV
jgi:hypothetical protein